MSAATENNGQLEGQSKAIRQLDSQPSAKRQRVPELRIERQFKVREFRNASGTLSWRIDGYKRDGTRVRKNYEDPERARLAADNLEAEYLGELKPENLRKTALTDEQIRLAEAAFLRLGPGREAWIVDAVTDWIKRQAQQGTGTAPKLDDAFTQFLSWLDSVPETKLRALSKSNLRKRVSIFINSMRNKRLSDISPESVDEFLANRQISDKSKDNDRRALSRFFNWCIERPRRWISLNPARKEKARRNGSDSPPAILTLPECERLLRAAQSHKAGALAPYVAVCLFGGLRPFEAARLTWSQVNIVDGEIRLEAWQTKTNRPRVVTVDPTLKAWLGAHKDKPFYPKNWRRDFDEVKAKAGFGNIERFGVESRKRFGELKPWPDDVMRHTAISHYFRQTGSYGRTAEQFGNSEAIIKRHYQARVSTEETAKFFNLLPSTL